MSTSQIFKNDKKMSTSQLFNRSNKIKSTSSSSKSSDESEDIKPETFVLKKVNLDGTPDMRYKENRAHFLKANTNKDGTLDMRKLSNRKKKGLYKD
jgi:hypothetical protein